MAHSMLRVVFTFGVAVMASACGRSQRPQELAQAHGKHVDFGLIDNAPQLSSVGYIRPKFAVTPYNQWDENLGYCGELSSIQAGMGAGQWMSQFNARLLCGAGLSQSGPEGFCAANNGTANYNSQFLFESENPGDASFASSPLCLANQHLAFQNFDYASQASGMAGYQQFMVWVKARVIAGDTVAIGVLNRGGADPQYDHEVTVSQIGTNHAVTDDSYYDDDVLYFEDHGEGGSSFTRGYAFSALAQSRDSANEDGANTYSILIPGGAPVDSSAGGDGIHVNPHAIVPADYGFTVSGPRDPQQETMPIALRITGSGVNGVANSPKGNVGYNFEVPEIGDAANAQCTNVPPTWMDITLEADVTGLTPGVAYNLYQYDFSTIKGLGAQAALDLPETNLNANAGQASKHTSFVASSSKYTQTIQTTSDVVVVVRCVRADAP